MIPKSTPCEGRKAYNSSRQKGRAKPDSPATTLKGIHCVSPPFAVPMKPRLRDQESPA